MRQYRHYFNKHYIILNNHYLKLKIEKNKIYNIFGIIYKLSFIDK